MRGYYVPWPSCKGWLHVACIREENSKLGGGVQRGGGSEVERIIMQEELATIKSTCNTRVHVPHQQMTPNFNNQSVPDPRPRQACTQHARSDKPITVLHPIHCQLCSCCCTIRIPLTITMSPTHHHDFATRRPTALHTLCLRAFTHPCCCFFVLTTGLQRRLVGGHLLGRLSIHTRARARTQTHRCGRKGRVHSMQYLQEFGPCCMLSCMYVTYSVWPYMHASSQLDVRSPNNNHRRVAELRRNTGTWLVKPMQLCGSSNRATHY